ncbi:MAG: adenylyl-sulfate kinase, partial [Planctomycetaceae bacterium]
EIKGFTAIDAPYEEPLNPELVVDSAAYPAEQLADEVLGWLERTGKIPTAVKT